MSFIKITCAHPGLRRAGIAHEKVKTWPADTFTADQLALLRADPAFVVEETATLETVARLIIDKLVDRATVSAVLRLLIAHSTVALIEDMTEAVAAAIERGDMHEEFQPLAWDIFEKHAIPEGRSGTAREAPSADSGLEAEVTADASGGAQPAAPLSDGAVPVPATDAASSAPQNTEGGAAGIAAHNDGAPTTSEAATQRLGDAPAEGAAAPETPAALAAGTDPNGEGGKGEEAAVRPAASASDKAKPAAKARPAKAKG